MEKEKIDQLLIQFENKNALATLEWAIERFADRIAIASSFGAEDVVLIDMMMKINKNAKIFTIDTNKLPKETYDVMEAIKEKYGIEIEIYYPQPSAVNQMVEQHGEDLFYKNIELRKLCCQVRKIEPLNRALSRLDAWICGLRRGQSITRSEIKKVEIDYAHGKIIKISPLADWTEKQVWDYIRTNDLPYNILHDKGYPSIGCAPCTRAIKPGEDIRAGRWWWESPEQKECGLHCVVCTTPEKVEIMGNLILPHGGKLINKILAGEAKEQLSEKIYSLKRIRLDTRQISDLELLSTGGYSPLEGFMCKDDYIHVVEDMRLANGLPWSIPITLPVSKEQVKVLNQGDELGLFDKKNNPLGVLLLKDIYSFDKQKEAKLVYRTTNTKHPGVAYLYRKGEFLLGGEIFLLNPIRHESFKKYRLSPAETRELFIKRGWKRIAGFQTRNPIHRAHEYIQKCALEIVDGLFIHPIAGDTKEDDIPAEIRIKSYEVILEKYYPKERVILGIYPAAMRYAGPREAIFHAIVRKNYGCSHFIVGRDHAGIGHYYRPFDSQYIFDEFNPGELGISRYFLTKYSTARNVTVWHHQRHAHIHPKNILI